MGTSVSAADSVDPSEQRLPAPLTRTLPARLCAASLKHTDPGFFRVNPVATGLVWYPGKNCGTTSHPSEAIGAAAATFSAQGAGTRAGRLVRRPTLMLCAVCGVAAVVAARTNLVSLGRREDDRCHPNTICE
ncbi:hypothetical protein GGI05_005055 [Coemansia sp. RSA 2603]|nr:hypothetical protein GGI05_005055 [Coemansia sp. RSA 2603]